MGFDIFSSIVVVITITMIVVNIGGLMYWWHITLNAVSLVNLVMVSTFQECIYLNIRHKFSPNLSSEKLGVVVTL
jgi:Niemann-Pick C1 protein